VEVAAQSGLDAMTSVETNPNERGLGKPCAGKPPARFDEGESSVAGDCGAALSTLLNQIDEVDTQLEAKLAAMAAAPQPATTAGAPKPRPSASNRGQPANDAGKLIARTLGVDLTTIPGINEVTVETLWAETASDLSAFKSGKHFASWFRLCPDNRGSGGRVLPRTPRRARIASGRPGPASR
jgi:transposase